MRKTPISVQDLRRRIYVKAKAEPTWRFWGLYVHVCLVSSHRETKATAPVLDSTRRPSIPRPESTQPGLSWHLAKARMEGVWEIMP
jgi:hypothetical protein